MLLLPLRPRPLRGELLSSWMMRLAHANVERLTYLTARVGEDRNFWTHDPDRWLRPSIRSGLSGATGVPEEAIDALILRRLEGTLFPPLTPHSTVRWLMPLGKYAGYRHGRPGLACCPPGLAESQYLRQEWRLSFVTHCPHHGIELIDACPACAASYAPLTNDLRRGRAWWGSVSCPSPGAPSAATTCGPLALQGRLLEALEAERLA